MKKIAWISVFGLGLIGVAQAEENLFFSTPLPCSDGWSACIYRGGVVDISSVKDSQGRLHPTTMRFGFFDLQPLPSVSPYMKLSSYSGEKRSGLQSDEQAIAEENNEAYVEEAPVKKQTRSTPVKKKAKTTKSSPKVQPVKEVVEQRVISQPVPEPEVVPEPEAVVTMTPEDQSGCMSLISLESAAMMGQLAADKISCLEKRIASNEPLTERRKVSLVLINNAQTKGDQAGWEKMVRRHLEKLDQSDPNLCFAYAIHVSRKGTSYAAQVIRWSDKALENKSQFSSGSDYTKKVYALYKLKTISAQKLWMSAESASPRDPDKITKYKGMTKDYSREWLDYAKASRQSIKEPFSLCVSAADKSFCDG